MKTYWTTSRHEESGGVYCSVRVDKDDVSIWMRTRSTDLAVAFDVEGARQAVAALTKAIAEAEALQAAQPVP
jgi:hypothetical protein